MVGSREQILPFVQEWIELLAQNRYEDAFGWLCRGEDEPWTPDLLRQLVSNYGTLEPRKDGRIFRVTSFESAVQGHGPDNPYRDVEWFDENESARMKGRVGDVHFDVPLDGEMSDLTAIFWIWSHDEGYVLQLEDLHVL